MYEPDRCLRCEENKPSLGSGHVDTPDTSWVGDNMRDADELTIRLRRDRDACEHGGYRERRAVIGFGDRDEHR